MKLTPEQKAFYEYGQAVESLRGAIYKIRKNALHEFGEPYYRLMTNEQKCLINAMGLASKIHTIRQKRAACRALMATGGRCCSNCLYKDLPGSRRPCAMCEDVTHWQPREEGE